MGSMRGEARNEVDSPRRSTPRGVLRGVRAPKSLLTRTGTSSSAQNTGVTWSQRPGRTVVALLVALVGLTGIWLAPGAATAQTLAITLALIVLVAAASRGLLSAAILDRREWAAMPPLGLAPIEAGSEFTRRVPITLRSWPRWRRLGPFRMIQPAIAVCDASSLPGHTRGDVLQLSRDGMAVWTPDAVVVGRAGVYTIGPTFAHVEGLLGVFSRSWQLVAAQELVVLPQPVALRHCVLGRQGTTVGNAPTLHAPERPPELAGVRLYRSGDRLTRVAWRASIRPLALNKPPVSKQFVSAAEQSLWILVDHDGARFRRDGRPLQLEPISAEVSELLRLVALSVAMYHLAHGSEVGMLVSGAAPGVVTPGAASERHRAAMRDMLARASTGLQRARQRAHEQILQACAQHAVKALDPIVAAELVAVGADGADGASAFAQGHGELPSVPGTITEASAMADATRAALVATEAGTTSFDQLLHQRGVPITYGQTCILITPHGRDVRARTVADLWQRGVQVRVAALGPASEKWRRQAELHLPTALGAPSQRAALIAALEGSTRPR